MSNKKELQLVNKAQAEKLRKLGFNYNCHYAQAIGSNKIVSHSHKNWNESDYYLSAPEIALVFQWLRNEKKLLISINPDLSSTVSFDKFAFRIYDEVKMIEKITGFLTYSEAESEALNKALDLLPL